MTVTHTAGVFALGAITLALSQYVLPETLYPWLNLVSGLLVVVIGVTVLRSHLRRVRARHHHHHHDHHHHDHDHDHGHSHLPQEPGVRGLLAMGAAAGLIPCPSALVVLLGAVAQGQIALGMLLIVAFSAGLAITLTVARTRRRARLARALTRARVRNARHGAAGRVGAADRGRRVRADRQGDPARRLMRSRRNSKSLASRVPSNQELR